MLPVQNSLTWLVKIKKLLEQIHVQEKCSVKKVALPEAESSGEEAGATDKLTTSRKNKHKEG
jgi:hypothetical protein